MRKTLIKITHRKPGWHERRAIIFNTKATGQCTTLQMSCPNTHNAVFSELIGMGKPHQLPLLWASLLIAYSDPRLHAHALNLQDSPSRKVLLSPAIFLFLFLMIDKETGSEVLYCPFRVVRFNRCTGRPVKFKFLLNNRVWVFLCVFFWGGLFLGFLWFFF